MDVRVKICGITNATDAQHVVEVGADYLGLVFAPSPRQVRAEDVRPWVEELHGQIEIVGVFQDAPRDEVARIIDDLDLDLVQLHGSESGKEWLELPVRVIEARPVDENGAHATRFEGAWADLFDAASGGGQGVRYDWDLIQTPVRQRRSFVAGGLNPDNVVEAVRQLHPFAVDVSSGVEIEPGRKDPQRVREFFENARGG